MLICKNPQNEGTTLAKLLLGRSDHLCNPYDGHEKVGGVACFLGLGMY
jgi:hypothetical protein